VWTYFLLAIGNISGLIGDIFLKRHGFKNLILGTILWAAGAFPTAYVLKQMDFSQLGILWAAMGVILTQLMGLYIYHETLPPARIAAMLLALMAIILAK